MPANYTALSAAWNAATAGGYLPAGVTGTAITTAMTPQQKLAAMQGWAVAGPRVDVPVGSVAGYLFTNLKISALRAYATTPPAGSNVETVEIANLLVMIASNQAPIQSFLTSQQAQYTALQNMLGMLAADASTGITTADVTALLALSNGPALEWDITSVATGGAGLPGKLSAMDLTAAKLATSTDFPGA